MEKILVFGYGNIVKHHIKNIRLINPNVKFLIVAKNAYKHSDQQGIKIVKNFKDLNLKLFKTVLICSPANTHLRYLQHFIKRKVKVFIEKPLDTNLKLAEKILKSKNIIKADIKIGYVFKYSKLANKIKNFLKREYLGNIKEVEILSSSYLPNWRKNKDYKRSVSAQKKLGGGVLLELSHEIDYLFWFFGEPQSFQSSLYFSKSIKTDVETGAIIKMIYKKGFTVVMKLDFHSKNKNERFCKIYGSKKKLSWYINKKNILIKNNNNKLIKKIYDNSDMFYDQMYSFIKKKRSQSTIKKEYVNSLNILKFIKKVKLKGKIYEK